MRPHPACALPPVANVVYDLVDTDECLYISPAACEALAAASIGSLRHEPRHSVRQRPFGPAISLPPAPCVPCSPQTSLSHPGPRRSTRFSPCPRSRVRRVSPKAPLPRCLCHDHAFYRLAACGCSGDASRHCAPRVASAVAPGGQGDPTRTPSPLLVRMAWPAITGRCRRAASDRNPARRTRNQWLAYTPERGASNRASLRRRTSGSRA